MKDDLVLSGQLLLENLKQEMLYGNKEDVINLINEIKTKLDEITEL